MGGLKADAIVLGSEGQLGADLVRLLGPSAGVSHREVSVTDRSAVDALLAARRPSVVFNCAAYNAVDRAESEPAAARSVNTDGAFHVAAACARHGARLVHFSTNFVFDGESADPYVETDRTGPLSVYATSKLDGERRVLDAHPSAVVIRTAALFGGLRGQSFPERILARASQMGSLKVVADQTVNPTYTADLAEAARALAAGTLSGVVHLVSGECCGWDELARAVLREFGSATVVLPVSTAEVDSAARRPRNGCLSSARVPPLRSWREGLRDWARRARAATA
ncbi:MAG TPA: dTDP-4-dehydrorhamnose reductase [Patescibacteria group bacterium]|nr:dTDP-4-dehydrorhamnose reductase [Patescibacteria group bacterium]